MLRRLFTARWLGALLAAAVVAVVAYLLGQWQWGRYEEKAARNHRLDTRYAAPPVPVLSVLGTSALPRSRDWTHVTFSGSYRPDEQLYVRDRVNASVYGFEILVPLELDTGGGTVLVDRGWVKNSDVGGAKVLPPVPAAPTGRVTVTGWVRPGEPSLERTRRPGQLSSMNVHEAAQALGRRVLDGYVLMERESVGGAEPARPAPLEKPDRDLGPHQAYAFQWWATMPVGFVLIWFGIRRELRDEAGSRAPSGGTPPPVPPRRKRGYERDAEAEDAEVEVSENWVR